VSPAARPDDQRCAEGPHRHNPPDHAVHWPASGQG
jgi:hypothetical protein